MIDLEAGSRVSAFVVISMVIRRSIVGAALSVRSETNKGLVRSEQVHLRSLRMVVAIVDSLLLTATSVILVRIVPKVPARAPPRISQRGEHCWVPSVPSRKVLAAASGLRLRSEASL
jgi:hypothetical protein